MTPTGCHVAPPAVAAMASRCGPIAASRGNDTESHRAVPSGNTGDEAADSRVARRSVILVYLHRDGDSLVLSNSRSELVGAVTGVVDVDQACAPVIVDAVNARKLFQPAFAERLHDCIALLCGGLSGELDCILNSGSRQVFMHIFACGLAIHEHSDTEVVVVNDPGPHDGCPSKFADYIQVLGKFSLLTKSLTCLFGSNPVLLRIGRRVQITIWADRVGRVHRHRSSTASEQQRDYRCARQRDDSTPTHRCLRSSRQCSHRPGRLSRTFAHHAVSGLKGSSPWPTHAAISARRTLAGCQREPPPGNGTSESLSTSAIAR